MTLPTSPTNNQGPFYTTNVPVNPTEGTIPPAPAPAANVAATVPSPATWNASNTFQQQNGTTTGTSTTQSFVDEYTGGGGPFTKQSNLSPGTAPLGNSAGGSIPVVPTAPSTPTGTVVPQQGTAAISNVTSITASFAGILASQIAVFKFQ